jgi:hypothetical protein
MTEQNNNNEKPKYVGRGGWRGGGRPQGERTCPVALRISPEAKEKLSRVYNKSEWLDEVIKKLL